MVSILLKSLANFNDLSCKGKECFGLNREEAGFTLVEVVVAIIVLSLVAVVFLQLYNGNLFAIMSSGQITQDLYVVQSALEEAILTPSDEEESPRLLSIVFPTSSGSSIELKVNGFFRTESSKDEKVSATVFVPVEQSD